MLHCSVLDNINMVLKIAKFIVLLEHLGGQCATGGGKLPDYFDVYVVCKRE